MINFLRQIEISLLNTQKLFKILGFMNLFFQEFILQTKFWSKTSSVLK